MFLEGMPKEKISLSLRESCIYNLYDIKNLVERFKEKYPNIDLNDDDVQLEVDHADDDNTFVSCYISIEVDNPDYASQIIAYEQYLIKEKENIYLKIKDYSEQISNCGQDRIKILELINYLNKLNHRISKVESELEEIKKKKQKIVKDIIE